MAFAAGAGATRAVTGAQKAPATAAAGGRGGNQQIVVRLELDGKLLEEKIVNTMNDELDVAYPTSYRP
jgi:hypothetical protein